MRARTPVSGIQLGLFALLLVVTIAGAAFAYALTLLNAQTERWWAIDLMDQRRETLILESHKIPPGLGNLNSAEMMSALEGLLAASEVLVSLEPDSELALRTSAETVRATQHFRSVEDANALASALMSELNTSLAGLFELTTQWRRELAILSLQSGHQEDSYETQRKELSQKQNNLTATHHLVDQIHRELENLLVLKSSHHNGAGSLQHIKELLADLPVPCRSGESATRPPDRVCRPSIKRVQASVEQLLNAEPTMFEAKVESALWALKAYARASEARFFELSDEIEDVSQKAAVVRQKMENLNHIEGSLSRLLRVLNDLQAKFNAIENGTTGDLTQFRTAMAGVLGQVRLRSLGVARGLGEVSELSDGPEKYLPALERGWDQIYRDLGEKDQAMARLQVELSSINAGVFARNADVRRAANAWIDLFSRTTFGTLLAVAGLISVATWAINRFVSKPLTRATNAIFALARGEDVRPISLQQSALGFLPLGQALETLRLVNIERRMLAQRNEEQRCQIEANLEDLEATTIEMERRATHDALTGLPNRRLSDEFLCGLNRLAEATVLPAADRDYCLMHLDVDRFKEINDTLGHEAGDAILCHVAQVLEELSEDEDITFRIGGDEFLIARVRNATQADAEVLANQIVQKMNEPVDFDGHACRIGASIGIAFGSYANFDARQTLINADLALYQAKNSGRNCFVYYSENMQKQTVARKALSDRILLAIENDEFVPFYQPQFFANDLSLRGLETLCRWEHPDHGILTPNHFLECAEDLKVIGKIDQILFRRAAEDLRWLRSQGLHIPKISFNVTADRLMHTDLADTLVGSIENDTKIAVELLESMSLDSLSESVRWSLDALKEKGIGIEIDDFGSCRASIAGLIAVGPDAMKIDGSIVGPITQSESHLRLVRAIIEIGNALDIDVVAERVETDEHTEILNDMGCKVLQGFALAKPMSAVDLAEFLSGDLPALRRSA